MRPRDFRTFSSEDEEINKLQVNIVETFFPLVSSPISGAALVGPVQLSTAPTQVAHKLGREFKGWLVVSPNAAENIFELARNSTSVTLQATGDVSASILVF